MVVDFASVAADTVSGASGPSLSCGLGIDDSFLPNRTGVSCFHALSVVVVVVVVCVAFLGVATVEATCLNSGGFGLPTLAYVLDSM